MFGVRDANSPKLADLDRSKLKLGNNADAAKFGDALVLATPWGATREAIAASGSLAGKVVLDATNPLLPALAGLDVGTTTSGGERVAEWATGAKVVKVFNTTGFNIMANPKFGADRSVMLYCGDDALAKAVAKQLADALGYDPVDAGPLVNARYLEPFAMVWIWLALKGGLGRDIAFKLMRR